MTRPTTRELVSRWIEEAMTVTPTTPNSRVLPDQATPLRDLYDRFDLWATDAITDDYGTPREREFKAALLNQPGVTRCLVRGYVNAMWNVVPKRGDNGTSPCPTCGQVVPSDTGPTADTQGH